MEKKEIFTIKAITLFIIAHNIFGLFLSEVTEVHPLLRYPVFFLFGFYRYIFMEFGLHILIIAAVFLIALALFMLKLKKLARIIFIISQFAIILYGLYWGFIVFAMSAGCRGGHIDSVSLKTGIVSFLCIALAPIIYCIIFMLPRVKEQFK